MDRERGFCLGFVDFVKVMFSFIERGESIFFFWVCVIFCFRLYCEMVMCFEISFIDRSVF